MAAVNGAYVVDWQRRRLLPAGQAHQKYDAALHHCVHGSRLIEWCGDCGKDLDAIAADLTAAAS